MPNDELQVRCDDGRIFTAAPATTALLAIDFQRDFLDPRGGCADAGSVRLRAVLPAAGEALAAARSAGVSVVHTREAYAPDLSDVSPLKRQMGYVGKHGPLGRALVRGEPGCEIVSEMAPAPGEEVVDKPGFSAFYRTDLEDRLRRAGVTHLVVMGVTAQCCVHSTLRDAVDRGFFCLTLDDACAAVTPELDDAVRQVIRGEGDLFGWIASVEQFATACDALAADS